MPVRLLEASQLYTASSLDELPFGNTSELPDIDESFAQPRAVEALRFGLAMPQAGFAQAYGMTELAPVATVLQPEYHAGPGRALGKARSAGTPISSRTAIRSGAHRSGTRR